ncbi:MAG: NADH-quinone oxidoreductase subunit NuoG [Candidatus Dasytiphilus stammeri]
MPLIHVDGKIYSVKSSENILQTCLSLNLDIPYFCWHPALGSVGSCRLCAVKQYQNANDTSGNLVMSCMTPVSADQTFISIMDPEAQEFRKFIMELLMMNHPHDCPVCEEGGNCHLQDMLVMTGHYLRRYRFTKRTHLNQDLGPLISHEMNRCIVCYRCIRYYKDYADGQDLGVYGTHDNIYFGRTQDGILESEFAGNLVEICPTGVFTDKTHSEHYIRKWDMQFAPSICQHCSVGCNISPGERYGNIMRIENRYHGALNQYFLCDRGRFGYGYVNLSDRPLYPKECRNGKSIILSKNQILDKVATVLRNAKKIIGIGSSRASIESNFALRELVGAKNFYLGLSDAESKRLALMLKVLRNSDIYTPSLREIESYDAILILGEDITQTNARVALAVRQAVKGRSREIANNQNLYNWHHAAIVNIGQQAEYPLFITNIDQTRLDDIAILSYFASAEDQARLGFAIAHALDNKAPEVNSLDSNIINKVNIIATALANAKKPLIISGSGAGSDAVIKAAINITKSLHELGHAVGLILLPAEVNSIGSMMLLNDIESNSLETAINELAHETADTVIILEMDLYRFVPKNKLEIILNNTSNIIVIDHQHTQTLEKAHFIFSTASFAESHGTVINYEGRAQRFFQVYDPSYYNSSIEINASWRWLHWLKSKLNRSQVEWNNIDHVIDACISSFPHLTGIKNVAPDSNFSILGKKLARKPQPYSGSTSMNANINVHEPSTPKDRDSMFTFSRDGTNRIQDKRQYVSFAWFPGWNSTQAWNKFQNEVGGTLRYGDPGVLIIESIKEKLSWFTKIPSAFLRTKGRWRVIPYYHLFGSDEMSQRATVIKKIMSPTYVMLNREDAIDLRVSVDMVVELSIMNEIIRLPVHISDHLPSGLIGLPLGFPGIPLFFNGIKIDHLIKVT